MKLLLLTRHAHAEDPGPANGAATDFDRPLTDRGRAEADALGDRLAVAGFAPDVILASAAVRTRETAERLAARLPDAPPVRAVRALYGATPAGHRAALAACDPAAAVLLVAHNPGVAEHLATLCGGPVRCPPATCGAFELDLSAWADFAPGAPAVELGLFRPG